MKQRIVTSQSPRKPLLAVAIVVVLGLGTAVLTARALYKAPSSLQSKSRESSSHFDQNTPSPGQFEPTSSNPVIQRYFDEAQSVPEGFELSVSHCLHLIKLLGTGTRTRIGDESVSPLSLVVDATFGKQVFGERPFIRTDFGLRFPTGASDRADTGRYDESHRDQCLATLAEAGLPLSFHLNDDGTPVGTIQDVLNDSIATSRLEQRELEWTAIAYSRYLPPVKTWRNRFGETCSFDLLAMELCSRPFDKAACGGVHCLDAVTCLLAADSDRQLLSASVRKELNRFINGRITHLMKTQLAEGCWVDPWSDRKQQARGYPFSQLDPGSDAFAITGHVAQWFRSPIPAEIIDPAVTDRASIWLQDCLRANDSSFWTNVCSITHALVAMKAIGIR